MFWSDYNSDRIYRAYLNGTGITTLISSGLSNTGKLCNVILDCIEYLSIIKFKAI